LYFHSLDAPLALDARGQRPVRSPLCTPLLEGLVTLTQQKWLGHITDICSLLNGQITITKLLFSRHTNTWTSAKATIVSFEVMIGDNSRTDCARAPMSNPNGLQGQKLRHYLKPGPHIEW